MYDHVWIELKKTKQQPPPPPTKNKQTKKNKKTKQKQKTTTIKTTTDICIRIRSSLMPSLDETHRGVKTAVNTFLVGGSKSCR